MPTEMQGPTHLQGANSPPMQYVPSFANSH